MDEPWFIACKSTLSISWYSLGSLLMRNLFRTCTIACVSFWNLRHVFIRNWCLLLPPTFPSAPHLELEQPALSPSTFLGRTGAGEIGQCEEQSSVVNPVVNLLLTLRVKLKNDGLEVVLFGEKVVLSSLPIFSKL